jgi:predicted TIM-barrel fold metal-dependent hydrolase
MIIDAHVHLPVSKPEKGFTFEKAKEKLLTDMKRSGIDYAILIPDNVSGSAIGDLDTCLKLVKNEKKLFLLGTVDIRKEVEYSKLDFLFEQGKIKGIKIFPGHDPIYPTDKRLLKAYKLCVEYGFPVVIHTSANSRMAARYSDPKNIVKLVKSFSDLQIVIAHYFWPKMEYCYEITRGYENIYFDTSALAYDKIIKKKGIEKIKKILTRTIEDNPKSILFGSDYAICSFESHIKLINSLEISKENKKRIFWKNANKLFKLRINFS